MKAVFDTLNLKAGDKVNIAFSSTRVRYQPAEVIRVTKTGICTVRSGPVDYRFNRDGRLQGQVMSNFAVLKWLCEAA